jgi:adenylate cyclase
MQRRLAAILLLDMVGYSRLMGLDEEGTIARQKAHRDEIIDPKLAAHGGRLVKTTGDGLLVEFPSVVDAVRCAVEVQEEIAWRETHVPEERRIQYRIGINLGDIVIDGHDILGDGVNVAARLEGLAVPGGICISGTAHDHLAGKLDVVFEDAGEKTVKNVLRPVRVWQWRTDHAAPSQSVANRPPEILDKPAIAVLPFANMSGDPEQEYFADGLTEDLLTALAQWRSFPIIARNSSFAYKRSHVETRTLGQELGAGYVLEGSVRKAGSRVRITAQLTDTRSGHQVWSEKYDRELGDVFALQDEIVQCIAALVAPALTNAELGRSTKKRTGDLDAWDLFLRALPRLRERSPAGNAEARRLFQAAIDAKADYADAYAGLAETFNMENAMDLSGNQIGVANQAIMAAEKAVRLNAESSWGHYVLSSAYQWAGRYDDALEEARISVSLNPNNAIALQSLGNKLDLAGDPSGITYMEKAQRLDPANAGKHIQLSFLARARFNIGDFEGAGALARKAVRGDESYAPAYFILALALGQIGQLMEAQTAIARCDELRPGLVEERRKWQPYKDPASNERLQAALDLVAPV